MKSLLVTAGALGLALAGSSLALESAPDGAIDPIFANGYENTTPAIGIVANQTINEDASAGPLSVAVSDPDTALNLLIVTASSNNPTLLPVGSLVLAGTGTPRMLTITPAANANGSAIVTLSVSDGSTSATRTFTLTVMPVNDAPVFTVAQASITPPSTVGVDITIPTVITAPGVGPANETASQTLVGYSVEWAGQTTALLAVAPTLDLSGNLHLRLRDNGAGAATPGTACLRVRLTDSGSNTAPNAAISAPSDVRVVLGPNPADCATAFSCATDSDADRLPNCRERGTLAFVDANDPGTFATVADTDGDSIKDGDEVLGTTAGLDLPALGARPLTKNILLEYDWFDEANDCAAHSHRPSATIATQVAQAYLQAPVLNPDGTTGIVMIQDYGQGGAFTGGNLIADADGLVDSLSTEFYALKSANFAAARAGYFHWVLLPHRYNTATNGSSGLAEINGDDLIVSLYCSGSTANVRNTVMHELGHNLGLRHGGNQNCNYKPNYNSVMNYRYQFPGIDTDCNVSGNGVPNYSVGTRLALNENILDENVGVCGSPAVDWNGAAGIESNIAFDINSADTGQATGCGGTLTAISDYNDWANITFTGILDADRFRRGTREMIECDNPAPK